MKSNLYTLQVTGSKERKSLSGAIKVSFATSEKFWLEAQKSIKKVEITPAFIIAHASDKQKNRFNKSGENLGAREIWSAWTIENIVRNFIESKK